MAIFSVSSHRIGASVDVSCLEQKDKHACFFQASGLAGEPIFPPFLPEMSFSENSESYRDHSTAS